MPTKNLIILRVYICINFFFKFYNFEASFMWKYIGTILLFIHKNIMRTRKLNFGLLPIRVLTTRGVVLH